MDPKELIRDDDAVSPVIGVILMVAITVILAAVIATFVLGLGDSLSNTAPQASFSFDYDGSTSLTITHDGGDPISESNIGLRGGGSAEGPGIDWDGSGTTGDNDIAAGSSYTYTVASGDTVRVIWQSASGDSTATLGQWTGPDA